MTGQPETRDITDPRTLLMQRCIEVGVETEWEAEHGLLRILIPNGKGSRRVWAGTAERAREMLEVDPGNVIFLGAYDACYFKHEGTIEVSLETRAYPRIHLQQLPGVERLPVAEQLDFTQGGLFGDSEEFGIPMPGRASGSDAWILPFGSEDNGGLEIELGSTSRTFTLFAARARLYAPATRRSGPRRHNFPTLRIKGIPPIGHDGALAILERVANSVFFELDLSYELCVRMWQPRRDVPGGVPAEFEQAPRAPKYEYPKKPLSLYWYGRMSVEFPLIEYLAYYQVLEFFYPSFSHRETLTKLRNELRDPRFRPEDDESLIRVLALASGTGKGYGTEREQLKSTISACVTLEQIRDLISGDDDLRNHFSGKQKIKGVAQVNLADLRADLLGSVANRVYDIRCRIVHAKEDGGGMGEEILLPFSKESEALGPDIKLVKFLAQKALISQATRLPD